MRVSRRATFTLVTLLTIRFVLSAAGTSRAAEDDGTFFEKRVRPVLVNRCFECHSGKKAESGLRVDSLAALLEGGERGPAIVPGKPDQSLLVLAINHGDVVQMPPKKKIPQKEIDDLTAWIKRGAHWPNAARPKTPVETSTPVQRPAAEGRTFWAFQPPRRPTLPPVHDRSWVRSPIDSFVLHKLEAAGLKPAPPAGKRALLRRATFDLVGLPPTPEETAAFLADESPDAFAKVVDRLLASLHYGERFGRMWLDVARYGDSNGLDENLAFANAYRYRDYVIKSFNMDKPYDEFLREQIAGDLLPSSDPAVAAERLVATGFLALGAKMLAEDDPVKMEMDIIDEQVDTLGRAVMGLTLGCARCHDHKFDPIPTADYYSLAGIFKSTKTMDNFSVVARWQERPIAPPEAVRVRDEHAARIAAKQAEIDRLAARANDSLLNEARRQAGGYLLAAHALERREMLLKQARPLGNDPQLTRIAGTRIVEAEAFNRGNVLRDTTSSYGQGIGVLVNKGAVPNFVEYDIELPGGWYQFELRYAAAEARPCTLSINGRVVKSDAAGKVTGSWNPDTQTWHVEGIFSVRSGKNVVRLEHPQYFPHIDKLLLAPARNITGQAAESAVPSSQHEQLHEPFVRQWAAYLERTRNDSSSVLAIWHRFVKHGAAHEGAKLDTPVGKLLLSDPRPKTLVELAQRYEKIFAEALQAPPKPSHEAFRHVLFDVSGPFALPKDVEACYSSADRNVLRRLRDEKRGLELSLRALPETMAVSEGKPQNLRIHIRGSHLTLGPEVPRRFPRILASDQQPPLAGKQSGRLEFARWLTSPTHPLTSRVMVNRVWQAHFGEGLVRSPDNFGRLGERPTHPELLDWLAVEFSTPPNPPLVRGGKADVPPLVRGGAGGLGWSLKPLHRMILRSSAYQMSTAWNEQAARVDPENRLLWRMSRRRLDAEAVRDAVLAVGGSVDRTMGGSLLPTPNRQYVTSTANVNPVIYETSRRSVYLPVVRSALFEFLQAFDFGDPSVMNGKRESTTVAPQALFMMNSKLVAQQSAVLAGRLLSQQGLDDAGRVRLAFEIILCRPPADRETAWALEYIDAYGKTSVSRSSGAGDARQRAWQSFCRALLASNEFIYVE